MLSPQVGDEGVDRHRLALGQCQPGQQRAHHHAADVNGRTVVGKGPNRPQHLNSHKGQGYDAVESGTAWLDSRQEQNDLYIETALTL
ncbi:hypothetical protein GCM10009560_57750 [Nonomuraea longicatena]|uniref:Transposase n=1 Tax=Nonomuraea longicatena TaxID=83682 RepID=A0ABP4B0A5_9ACTN